jgi:hypothetical protein
MEKIKVEKKTKTYNKTYLRDVAMNGVGAFLKGEILHDTTRYAEDGEQSFAEFDTADGRKWSVTVEEIK